MKTNVLLPHQLKRIGWLLFIPGLLLGVLVISGYEPDFLSIKPFVIVSEGFGSQPEYFSFSASENNFIDEIAGVLIIIGSIFIAFSKEKFEDEFISEIRLQSLVWATYINYAVLVLAILFVFEMSFFTVLVFNMFTILLFFLIRYNWALIRTNKSLENEE